MNKSIRNILILSLGFFSIATSGSNKGLLYSSILKYVADSSSARLHISLAVSDSNNITFNISDTVNAVGDKSNTIMFLYSDYISHKYNKSVKQWDDDSLISKSVDSLAQFILPYFSYDLQKLSTSQSRLDCYFAEYEPSYIGVSIKGPLHESLNLSRLMSPKFSVYILFHIESDGSINIVGEHLFWLTGKR